jgi:hypothetical protein
MQELIAYNQWLIKNQNRFFQEYLDSLPKNNKALKSKLDLNVQDIINYAYDLYDVPLQYRNLILTDARRGNNDIANAKGMVVNYILNNNIKTYDYRNIYTKLFNYKTDRTTSLKYRNKDFNKEEPNKWKLFIEYIETNTINWNPIMSKEDFFKLLSKKFKIDIKDLYVKTAPATHMNTPTIIRGIIIKYLKINNLKSNKEICEIFKINFTSSNCNFWKIKKLNQKDQIIYDFIISIMDNYTIIWT